MDAMLLLKASLLLAASLLAARLLGRAPALIRHRLWTLAFAAVLALPLLVAALPAIHVPMPAALGAIGSPKPGETPDKSTATSDRVTRGPEANSGASREPAEPDASAPARATGLAARPDQSRSATTSPGWPSLSGILLATWLAGTSAAGVTLLLSLVRSRQLMRASSEVADAAWRATAEALSARLGLTGRVRLLRSPTVRTPMAGGIWRPVIFLPRSSSTWSAERREVVLAHEIGHLAERDPLRHLVARLAVACYWFNPLAWLAARQASVAQEQACDESVLALGTRRSTYARVLLELSESMPAAATAVAALPMVEPTLLETRVMAILNHAARPATRRRLVIPVVGAALFTFAVAAVQPSVTAAAPSVPAAMAPRALASSRASVAMEEALGASPQAEAGRDSACWSDPSDNTSFSGTISMRNAAGRLASGQSMVIDEQIGTRGGSRVIQQTLGDLRLCMVADGVGESVSGERPSQWLARAGRVVMEARGGAVAQRLEIGRDASGAERISWRVGSAERAFDAAAKGWRDRILAVFDTTWEIASLRGEQSSLRGRISSIHGQESSLRGEISSLRGRVSSMHGRASSVRGEESSLRGRISSIQGHVSSLRGEISSEQGSISSLKSGLYRAGAAERGDINSLISRHEGEIARIEKELREYGAEAKVAVVEREIAALGADAKIAAIEAEIRAFNLEGKVADVERRIAALDVSGNVAAIERQITALDADRRVGQLESRRDEELKRLETVVASIR